MVRIRTHANPFQVPDPGELDLEQLFGRSAPLLLEIGFGRGDFLLGLARAHPAVDVLGLEIRRALVEHARERAQALQLGNASALLADASRHLAGRIPPGRVAAAFVLFPDPWRKKKHLKRRVLRAPLLDALAAVLDPAGTLDFQTDSLALAEEADREVAEHPGWVNLLGVGQLEGAAIPDCNSRRCRMHRERGATIYKMRFALAGGDASAPSLDRPDPWLGFDPELPQSSPS